MHAWMDGWMDGWMDVFMYVCVHACLSTLGSMYIDRYWYANVCKRLCKEGIYVGVYGLAVLESPGVWSSSVSRA